MTAPVPARPAPQPRGVRRSRTGAVLGGVCAGVARSAGLDPLLLRVVVVAVTVLTGGAGLLAYLAAWVLIPRETDTGGQPRDAARPDHVTPDRIAPNGTEPDGAEPDGAPDDLAAASTGTPPTGDIPAPRSPLAAADDAATALGEHLRAPEVQAGARKAATSVSQALNASVDELGRRIRRDPG
jgi:phage shock protein PspC (stress-responsive transcriptional regulator)